MQLAGVACALTQTGSRCPPLLVPTASAGRTGSWVAYLGLWRAALHDDLPIERIQQCFVHRLARVEIAVEI